MKKILFASLATLLLTACGGNNDTEMFLGKWVEQNSKDPSTLFIANSSSGKVTVEIDIGIAKSTETYLVENEKLIHTFDNQVTYTLNNDTITSTDRAKTTYKKL